MWFCSFVSVICTVLCLCVYVHCYCYCYCLFFLLQKKKKKNSRRQKFGGGGGSVCTGVRTVSLPLSLESLVFFSSFVPFNKIPCLPETTGISFFFFFFGSRESFFMQDQTDMHTTIRVHQFIHIKPSV